MGPNAKVSRIVTQEHEIPGLPESECIDRRHLHRFITPALEKSGWDVLTRMREESPLVKGCVIVRGKLPTRARYERADYVPFHKPNFPTAVIEAKGNTHAIGTGCLRVSVVKYWLSLSLSVIVHTSPIPTNDHAGKSSRGDLS
jgi:hypothetical protein